MKYIPMEKRSKREQRAFHAAQRGSWNGINPVSRVAPNLKRYNRNRIKQAERRSGSEACSACFCVYYDQSSW